MLFHSVALTSHSMTVQTSRAFGKVSCSRKTKPSTQCDDHFVNWVFASFPAHFVVQRHVTPSLSTGLISTRSDTPRLTFRSWSDRDCPLSHDPDNHVFVFASWPEVDSRAQDTQLPRHKKANTLRRTFIISSASKSFTFEDTSIAFLTPSAASPCVEPSVSSVHKFIGFPQLPLARPLQVPTVAEMFLPMGPQVSVCFAH